jgi:hypothetical protein
MADIKIVKKSKSGIDYLNGVLKEKDKVVTKAAFWKIPRENHDDRLSLKLGRYNKGAFFKSDTLGCDNPKSELTLDDEELHNLIKFIEENHTPLLLGAGKYVKANADLDIGLAKKLQDIFKDKDAEKVGKFFTDNDLLSYDVSKIIEYLNREKALAEYELKLDNNDTEYEWQKWFGQNTWILGNEFTEVLDERQIDTKNIADYLMETFDGFVDLVEIKRPEEALKFWSDNKDHDNLIPSLSLIKAVTQVQNYVQELEEEMDSVKTRGRLGVPTIKPRATLIYGRSNDWADDEKRAFRLLNVGYQNLTILTYDHVLSRARKTLLLNRGDKE